MSQHHAISAQSLSARPARRGETLGSIAKKLYADERVAALLADLNPEIDDVTRPLDEGVALRMPSPDYVQSWARRLGLACSADAGALTRGRRWAAYASAPRAPRHVLGDEVERLVNTDDFAQLLQEVSDLDTAGRGHAVWDMLAGLGDTAVRRALGQRPAELLVDGIDGDTRQDALSQAMRVRATGVLAQQSGRALQRCQQLLTCSVHKPERLARLIVALAKAEPERRAALGQALGLSVDEVEAIAAAAPRLKQLSGLLRRMADAPARAEVQVRDQARQIGLDADQPRFARLLSRCATSQGARLRLAVKLAGLVELQKSIKKKLDTLSTVMGKVCLSLQEDQAPLSVATIAALANSLGFVVEGARQDLGIQSSDSLAAAALQEVLDLAAPRLHPLQQLATRLPSLLGPTLVELDAASVEKGLAVVVKSAQAPRSASSAPGLMSAADLMARAGASSGKQGQRQGQVREIAGLLVQVLDMPPAPASAADRRRALIRFEQRFTQHPQRAQVPARDQIQRDIQDCLRDAASSRNGDVQARARRVRRFLDDNSDFYPLLRQQLGDKMPPAGRRRLGPQGLALLGLGVLLDACHSLGDAETLAEACADFVLSSSGLALDAISRQTLGARLS